MFEESGWLPPSAQKKTHIHVAVPRITSKPVLKAAYTYQPRQRYTLFPNFFPFGSKSATPVVVSDLNPVTIQIQYPLDIGYRHRSQVVIAEIVQGSSHLKGLKVVMRCFDPIFHCPADLPAVLLPRIPPPSLLLMANEVEASHSTDINTSTSGPDSHKTQTAVPIKNVDTHFHNVPLEIQDQIRTELQHARTSKDDECNPESLATASTRTMTSVSASKVHITNMIQSPRTTELLAYRDTYEANVLPYKFLSFNFQEYPTFNEMEDPPVRGYMSPAKFSKIMFEHEVTAYTLLKSIEGKSVPIFYGHYHIVLPDREFYHDQVVYVVLLEYVEGTPLSHIPIHEMDDESAENLWSKVLKATRSVHEAGVVQRFPHLRKLLWRKESQRGTENEIVWTDFSYSQIISEMNKEEGESMTNHEVFAVLDYMENALNAI